jgi:peptidoglycan/LPS O-acetylase OafA/YrhL
LQIHFIVTILNGIKVESRIHSLDFLRALAIVFVLLDHLPDYKIPFLGIFSPYFGRLGVGLFIFVSGYLMFLTNRSFHSNHDILEFYKKRALRIFPLYLIALLVFFVVYGLLAPRLGFNPGMDFSLDNMIIHTFGLQILLSPAYATPLLTLYFIGLIVIFYLIYPFLIKFSKNVKEFLLISLIPFIIFLFLRDFFTIIDDYFFKYYFVFIAGIVFCYISSSGTKNENTKQNVKFLLAVPAILVFSLIMELKGMVLYAAGLNSDISTIISYVLIDIVIISFCLLQVEIANLFFDDFSSKTKDLIFLIAFASFAVYLFHRPILTVFYGGTLVLGIPVIVENLIMIFIAVPLVFIISYYIQYYEEKIRLSSLKSSR